MNFASSGERISLGVRAHALYARMLTPDDYLRLVSSDGIAEIVQKLRRTSYDRYLRALPSDPHRDDVESAVQASLFVEAASISTHLTGPRQALFKEWLRLYEADDLKRIGRYIYAGRKERNVLMDKLSRPNGSLLPYERLLEASDMNELSDALVGTRYEAPLTAALQFLSADGRHSLFAFEMAIDGFVAVQISKAIKALPDADRRWIEPIFGTMNDLMDLNMIYRAIKFYRMTPEEIISRLMPATYKISQDQLGKLAYAHDLDEFAELLREDLPRYADVMLGSIERGEPEIMIERSISTAIFNHAKRAFSSGPPGFHTMVGYFIMRAMETADIIKMIECVRYGVDRRMAADLMIRRMAAGGENIWQ